MAIQKKGHTSLSHLYILVLGISLSFGLGFPQYGIYLFPFITFLLGCIFFFSALKLHLKDIKESAHDIKTISLAVILKLIILPIVVYYTALIITPSLAIPFLLLAAMPTAMTAPLFTTMAHGKQSFSLVLSIVTSLLAPLTIPLIIQFLVKSSISVDIIDMCIRLILIIFLPIALAEGIKKFAPRIAKKVTSAARAGSLGALGLLLTGVTAVHASTIINTVLTEPAKFLIPLAIFFLLTHVIGYSVFFWLKFKKRVAATVSIAYMNFTLAIYLSTAFFPDHSVLIPIIISAIPWSIAIIPFAEIAAHHESA